MSLQFMVKAVGVLFPSVVGYL